MKLFSIVFLSLILGLYSQAQEVSGTYLGELKLPSMSLRLVLNIEGEGQDAQWTLDSPDQGAKGIVADSHSVIGQQVYFQVSKIMAFYKGNFNDRFDEITGEFSQGGQRFDLVLTKQDGPVAELKRPQEPKPPFDYKVKEVQFKNEKDGVELAGTLTMPSKGKNFTGVVLVSGSGPQDRNEELMMHKPFLVLADFLTRNGFAVLRYDDRGVGGSTGSFSEATTFDFANDAEAAAAYLSKQKKVSKVGIIGHSEGGLIAPIVASRNQEIDFIVLLASPGTDMKTLLLKQIELIMALNGDSDEDILVEVDLSKKVFDLLQSDLSDDEVKAKISNLIDLEFEQHPEVYEKQKLTKAEVKTQLYQQVLSNWFRTILRIDPADYLPKVDCPVYALNGDKDCQVPAEENLARIAELLNDGGNQNFKCQAYPNLNHLFQKCETGAISEYVQIEETMNEKVLQDLVNWLAQLQ